MVGIKERLQLIQLPNATILCTGIDTEMLQDALRTVFPDFNFVNEANLSPASLDGVIAHFALSYSHDVLPLLWRYRAALKPDGLLFCSHFGLDTLQEWRAHSQHILPNRCDMHELGDLLLHAGFSDPVIDVDYYYTRHRKYDHYLHELQLTCMLKESAGEVDVNVTESGDGWLTTYEIIYAHAFAKQEDFEAKPDNDMIVKIPVSKIGRIMR